MSCYGNRRMLEIDPLDFVDRCTNRARRRLVKDTPEHAEVCHRLHEILQCNRLFQNAFTPSS